MPLRPLKRRPTMLLFGLLAAAVLFAIFRPAADPSPLAALDPEAQAVLVVDGIDYQFELDTCFVGEDSFVVAGHGVQDDQDFRVLASPSEVEVAFGVVDESEPVPDDSLWLRTKDNVAWSTNDSVVTARLSLIERLGDEEIPHAAELNINCGSVS